MTRTKTILTIGMLLTGVFALGLSNASVFAASNIVTNGSFEESNTTCVGLFTTLNTGSGTLTGWNITDGNVDWICNYWPASDGERSLDMVGNTPGTISQDLSTTVGTVYQVDFDMATNTDGPPTDKKMLVSAADSSEIFTSVKSAFLGEWEQKTFYFIATNSTTTLEFKSIDPAVETIFYGPTLDNVSAEAPKKLDVCHKEKNTINISNNAVSAHLAHGDMIGVC